VSGLEDAELGEGVVRVVGGDEADPFAASVLEEEKRRVWTQSDVVKCFLTPSRVRMAAATLELWILTSS
jgi:hypothetical protein